VPYAAKFIGERQRPVHDAIVGENDGVFKRAAAKSGHGLERLDIAFEAKRAGATSRWRKVSGLTTISTSAGRRGGEENPRAAHAKFIGGIYADAAVASTTSSRPQNLQVASPSAELSNAALLQHLHKRLGGAVQNRYFNRINVDKMLSMPQE